MHPQGMFNHTWSLTVEEVFYLAWVPFLILRRTLAGRLAPFLALIPLAMLTRFINAHPGIPSWVLGRSDIQIPYIPVFGELDAIAMGALLALLWKPVSTQMQSWSLVKRNLVKAVALLLIFVRPLTLWDGYWAAQCDIFIGGTVQSLAAAVTVALAANPMFKQENEIWDFPPLAKVGLASYSIYIFQQVFFWPTPALGFLQNEYWNVPAAIVAGLLIFKFVEQPLNRTIRRVGSAK